MTRFNIVLVAVAALAAAGAGSASAQVIERAPSGEIIRIGDGWTPAPGPEIDGFEPTDRAGEGRLVPARFRAAVLEASARHRLSPDLIDAVIRQESGYDPAAVSPAGAIGLMQLMPGTARELGVDPRNPVQNIMGGSAYLRAQLDRFEGDIERALAAYNAGPGAVDRFNGVPPYRETRAYVVANLERMAARSLTPPDGDHP